MSTRPAWFGPRLLAGAALGVALLGAVAFAHFGGAGTAWVEGLLRRVQDAGELGWLAFALAQMAVAMSGVVPASLLGMAAGVAYGVELGFALSAVGTLAGGWLAFFLSRTLLRSWIAERLSRMARPAMLDEAVGREGWRLVCLLRVSPIMPFAVTSYALGLTRIGGRDYVLGTLAALPALLGYVAAGAITRAGLAESAHRAGLMQLGLLGLGVLATLLLTIRLGQTVAKSGVFGTPSR